MYCCPISAFNWCPRGRAGRELGRSLLSTLLHTEKVKFITRCGNPLGEQRARRAEKGEWPLRLAEEASSNLGGSWGRVQNTRVLLSFLCRSVRAAKSLRIMNFLAEKPREFALSVGAQPHVVSHLVNNGCLLTRMRRLNNPGGRLNTPHQGAGS